MYLIKLINCNTLNKNYTYIVYNSITINFMKNKFSLHQISGVLLSIVVFVILCLVHVFMKSN